PAYEAAHADFVNAILDPKRSPRFLASLHAFVETIAPAGIANALGQTVLRLTTSGVPDTYQGTEFWDFSLVDPDNRREVDFSLPAPVARPELEPFTIGEIVARRTRQAGPDRTPPRTSNIRSRLVRPGDLCAAPGSGRPYTKLSGFHAPPREQGPHRWCRSLL